MLICPRQSLNFGSLARPAGVLPIWPPLLFLHYFVWLGCADCLSGNKCLTWKRFTFIETICIIVIICEANGRSHFVLLLMKDWQEIIKLDRRDQIVGQKVLLNQGRSQPKHAKYKLIVKFKGQIQTSEFEQKKMTNAKTSHQKLIRLNLR